MNYFLELSIQWFNYFTVHFSTAKHNVNKSAWKKIVFIVLRIKTTQFKLKELHLMKGVSSRTSTVPLFEQHCFQTVIFALINGRKFKRIMLINKTKTPKRLALKKQENAISTQAIYVSCYLNFLLRCDLLLSHFLKRNIFYISFSF